MSTTLLPAETTAMRHSSGTYGNFRNPIGLVLRMLKTRDSAALGALLREALKIAATPLDLLMSLTEKRMLSAAPASSLPIVLIVGAPRSGTTLVYQTLAHYCEMSYFSNLAAMFPRSPLAATRLCSPLQTSPADFHSYYGQTAPLLGPNDAFSLWNRWLGCDRYSTPDRLADEVAGEMRSFFAAWSAACGLPFLNKNNRNTDCCGLLASTLADVRLLVVRRNPLFVAQSLIHARESVQGDKHVGWGLASRERHSAAGPLGYIDDVCEQLVDIETRLVGQLDSVERDRVIECSYEDFCTDPRQILDMVCAAVPQIRLRTDRVAGGLRPFEISQTLRLGSAERRRIERNLAADHFGTRSRGTK